MALLGQKTTTTTTTIYNLLAINGLAVSLPTAIWMSLEFGILARGVGDVAVQFCFPWKFHADEATPTRRRNDTGDDNENTRHGSMASARSK